MPDATRLQRIFATLIDLGIPAAVIALCIVATRILSNASTGAVSVVLAIPPVSIALIALIILLAINVFFLIKTHQTIGKKLMRIKIIRTRYEAPASTLLLLTFHLAFIPILFIPHYIGIAILLIDTLFLFTPQRRCLHDKLTGTHAIQIT